LEKVKVKLGWKVEMLSQGARLLLVNHVLDSIPMFNMGVFDIPKGILEKIEKIVADFF
jgi:hypothetical protein